MAGTVNRIAIAIGIVAGLIAIYQFVQGAAYAWYLIPAFIAPTAAFPLLKTVWSLYSLKRLLRETEDVLLKQDIRPDRIIAFDRSSAVFGGMLAQRLGVEQLLSLPRVTRSSEELTPREIVVGRGVKIDLDPHDLDKSLVIVFHLRTGSTFESGINTLGSELGEFKGKTLAIYATSGAIARFPSISYVKNVKDGDSPNSRLPWISGQYIHK